MLMTEKTIAHTHTHTHTYTHTQQDIKKILWLHSGKKQFSKHINVLYFGHLAGAPIMTHFRQTQRPEAVCVFNL